MIPKTVAILVNYNGFHDTTECVKTLFNQTVPLHKIVIVDNASPNNDYEKFEETFSDETNYWEEKNSKSVRVITDSDDCNPKKIMLDSICFYFLYLREPSIRIIDILNYCTQNMEV